MRERERERERKRDRERERERERFFGKREGGKYYFSYARLFQVK